MIFLRKGQDICSISLNDLAYSIKFTPSIYGIDSIIFNVLMPAKSECLNGNPVEVLILGSVYEIT